LPPILQRETETASSVKTLLQEKVQTQDKMDDGFEFLKDVLGVDLNAMKKLYGPTPRYHR
jgi:hypothetical protein